MSSEASDFPGPSKSVDIVLSEDDSQIIARGAGRTPDPLWLKPWFKKVPSPDQPGKFVYDTLGRRPDRVCQGCLTQFSGKQCTVAFAKDHLLQCAPAKAKFPGLVKEIQTLHLSTLRRGMIVAR